jgi:hypothetical protein
MCKFLTLHTAPAFSNHSTREQAGHSNIINVETSKKNFSVIDHMLLHHATLMKVNVLEALHFIEK